MACVGDTQIDNTLVDDSRNIELYIQSLSKQEQLVLKIAQSHLESSFDIVKSIGYKKWLETQTPG